jgi:hypothetical protein
MNDVAKDCTDRALKMGKQDINHYLSSGDASDQRIALFIEVAKKAADEKRMDVPRSILSHVLRKRIDKRALLTCDNLVGILKNNSLPTPAEQANNFITFLGEHLSSPGDFFPIPDQRSDQPKLNIYGLLGIKTGAAERRDLDFLIKALEEQKLLNVKKEMVATVQQEGVPSHMVSLESGSLTLGGWQKYEELRRSVKDSRRAFVAMEFPKSTITENYFFQYTLLDKYLVPAVREIGWDLANALMSEPTAGNLHARMEVEIRRARFVVAELSHHNNGAYWEAGFARGLGKPVIYMFNKAIGKADRPPHFDVVSDLYVPWEEDKPEKAAEDLKAVILATLFEEAVIKD